MSAQSMKSSGIIEKTIKDCDQLRVCLWKQGSKLAFTD
jgi:hypothetical protein